MSDIKRLSETEPSSYSNYVIGFILSLVCTLSAYFLVTNHYVSNKWGLAGLVAILALIQFVVQIVLFLHLGKERSPRFKLLVFSFMLCVVLILVGGSIWIMYNLNYKMTTPTQINKYMNQQDGGL